VTAANPLRFGRRTLVLTDGPEYSAPALSDDVRLFATTFAVGFLFVSVLIF
jgi:hypothetical protein